MNLHPRRPADAEVARLLATQRDRPLTYAQVGATAGEMPASFPRRERAAEVDNFEKARHALRGWRQYDLGWCHVARPRPPIVAGEHVATVARVWGLWTVNCCRLVSAVDEPDVFGYTIGTLPLHSEIGEERFLLERTPGGGGRFTIRSFSGPSWWLVRLGWPVAAGLVRRFLREATAKVQAEAAG